MVTSLERVVEKPQCWALRVSRSHAQCLDSSIQALFMLSSFSRLSLCLCFSFSSRLVVIVEAEVMRVEEGRLD
jgi:hypothetical protein